MGKRGPKPGTPEPELGKEARRIGMAKARAVQREKYLARQEILAANPGMKSRHQMLLDGELSVRDLDDAEVIKGRGRDIAGEFKGVLRAIPPKVVQQLQAEIIRRHTNELFSALPEVTQVLVELATNPDVRDETRLKAALAIVERVVGKVPQDIRVASIDPWEPIISAMMAKGEDEAIERARQRLSRMTGPGSGTEKGSDWPDSPEDRL